MPGAALQPVGGHGWAGGSGLQQEHGPASPSLSHPHYQIIFLTPKGGSLSEVNEISGEEEGRRGGSRCQKPSAAVGWGFSSPWLSPPFSLSSSGCAELMEKESGKPLPCNEHTPGQTRPPGSASDLDQG